LKLPAHVLFRKDWSLMLWKPHGTLDEAIVKEIVAFIDVAEERASKPFNRFADLSALAHRRLPCHVRSWETISKRLRLEAGSGFAGNQLRR